ncbi:hypothetical protein D3C86_1113510 [compost metagenome]
MHFPGVTQGKRLDRDAHAAHHPLFQTIEHSLQTSVSGLLLDCGRFAIGHKVFDGDGRKHRCHRSAQRQQVTLEFGTHPGESIIGSSTQTADLHLAADHVGVDGLEFTIEGTSSVTHVALNAIHRPIKTLGARCELVRDISIH